VSSFNDALAQKFGLDKVPDYDTRYDRAAEFVDVVRQLWDCWEDDAFIRDKASGVNYLPEKSHAVDHRGKYFKVAGTLNVTRTPQGAPVIVQAGASDQGRELAAATADALYAASQTLEEAQAYYASVKGRMAKYGRAPDDLKIMPGIMAVPGRTLQEAEDKYEQLQALVEPAVGLSQLAWIFGDLSAYDIDGPVPETSNPRMRSRAQLFMDVARRDNLSIRGLYLAIAGGAGHRRVVGTPSQIADAMEEWFVNEAADGFNILPTHLPGGLEDVVDMVVPELQRRGLYRTAYEGNTLRANLGVPTPANRFAKTR
jgi:alkanesulfonate monooxygenase